MAPRPSPSTLRLCDLTEIAEGAATAIPLPAWGSETAVLLFRRSGRLHVYWDRCPHMGTSLRWGAKILLAPDGMHLRCASHDASFRILDGSCVRGPCVGEALETPAFRIVDGALWLDRPGAE